MINKTTALPEIYTRFLLSTSTDFTTRDNLYDIVVDIGTLLYYNF
ncbi:MAG: hypothetical protein NZ601_06555 [candidate division WOR-3 bacterium]|nr:hypothetical protein [candidate division WOR-3 bacterium]MCX7757295.1 hypothetical protein [candidate division WOR-3 bacterium]MDW7988033.1 hypothetical protein [candidate division WOR-3 bacterium]